MDIMTYVRPSRVRAAGMLMFAAGLAAASPAMGGSYTFEAFNPDPAGVSNRWRSQNMLNLLGGNQIPVGTYVGYDVQVDWSGNLNEPALSSRDARMIFTTAAIPATSTQGFPIPLTGPTRYTTNVAREPDNGSYYDDNDDFTFTPDSNGVNNLRFRGGFNNNYVVTDSSAAPALNLGFRHQFTGTDYNWSNVRVTLYDNYTEMLGATDLGVLTPGTTSITVPYNRTNNVQWFKFQIGEAMSLGDFLTVDTLGTQLAGLKHGQNDTQLILWNSSGNAFGNTDHTPGSDDFSLNGARKESMIGVGDVGSSPLADASGYWATDVLFPGQDFYVSVSPRLDSEYAFNLTEPNTLQPGMPFALRSSMQLATPGVDPTGFYTINFNTNIAPAPGAAALLGIGGLLASRRRR